MGDIFAHGLHHCRASPCLNCHHSCSHPHCYSCYCFYDVQANCVAELLAVAYKEDKINNILVIKVHRTMVSVFHIKLYLFLGKILLLNAKCTCDGPIYFSGKFQKKQKLFKLICSSWSIGLRHWVVQGHSSVMHLNLIDHISWVGTTMS